MFWFSLTLTETQQLVEKQGNKVTNVWLEGPSGGWAARGACWQAWRSEFDPQDSHGGRTHSQMLSSDLCAHTELVVEKETRQTLEFIMWELLSWTTDITQTVIMFTYVWDLGEASLSSRDPYSRLGMNSKGAFYSSLHGNRWDYVLFKFCPCLFYAN